MADHKLPREDVVRAKMGDYEYREQSEGEAPMLRGHFAKFDEWTEINSGYEGNFMERIQEGAFAKTFTETTPVVLLNHGHDVMGDQILGVPKVLREDSQGAYYEVELFDGVPQLIKDGLRANTYGASFRFRVMREEVNPHAERSDHNPKGLPERTIKEAAVAEFGPVTFPAYAGATASLRSMTDEYIAERIGADKLRDMIAEPVETPQEEVTPEESTEPERTAPSQEDADVAVTSSTERREIEPETSPTTTTKENTVNPNASLEELRSRVADIADEMGRIDAEAGTGVLQDAQKEQWNTLKDERHEINDQIAAKEERLAELESVRTERTVKTTAREGGFNAVVRKTDDDIYNTETIRDQFGNPQGAVSELKERAKRSIERSEFMEYGDGTTREDLQERVERLVKGDSDGAISRRILNTGRPGYEDAFWKKMAGRALTRQDETLLERALGVATTGYAMPYTLDPTVLLTSNGQVNPLRQVARVVQIGGMVWNGVNSAGVSASYDAEGVEVSDDTPTLSQPTVTTLKAQAFVPYSIESENWSDIRSELAREIADAKDVLEATKFTLGTGSPEPQGFTIGATSLATTAGTAAIALADIDTLMDALPPRFQARAVMLANRKFFSKVRQLARTAGVNDQWPNVAPGTPGTINGAPAYECSDMSTTITTSAQLVATYGDFYNSFLIVDSIGMNVEYVPTLFHTTSNRPSGQRGIHAYWMNSSVVRTVAGLRTLKVL